MDSRFNTVREEVEAELRRIFDRRNDIPETLLASMKYSIFAGGKRLRPVLLAAAAEAVGGDRGAALPTAAAFEMIHTYTLIHDDLPSMDDDDLRRGMPTNHIKFGEPAAILAGDALLTLAFEVMAEPLPDRYGIGPDVQLRVVQKVAEAVGARGTVGGQMVDIEYEGRNGDMNVLEYIHRHKTGTMLQATVECGGLLGGANEDELAALAEYGAKIGLAFQIIDDILDVEGDTAQLGKKAGADQERKKMTYPSLCGLETSRQMSNDLIDQALAAIDRLSDDNEYLKDLARFVAQRTH